MKTIHLFLSVMAAVALAHVSTGYIPGNSNPETEKDTWLVTWREWEPDPAAFGWVYANVCDEPGCHTVKHWGYHTRAFDTHESAIEWLNRGYNGAVENVLSLRRCSLVPLQRKVTGNKTVQRTITVEESVPDEQWSK